MFQPPANSENLSEKFRNYGTLLSILNTPFNVKIKTILLWLKGLENLEDESVIEKFPAFSQHFKKKNQKPQINP